MSWYTAFGGGCVDDNVDNEWAGAWGRQKGRQWGYITQLRAWTVLGQRQGTRGRSEAYVGMKLAGLWSGQKGVREQRDKHSVGIPTVTVHDIQRWEAWEAGQFSRKQRRLSLDFFFFINWLACWLGSGVSLKCPCGSGMVPSWRLLGAGETLKRWCLGRCKVIRAMKNQDRGSHFLPLLFTSQMWGKQSCPIPYFLTRCAFLP